eukprot:520511-Pleurochrysis_carterae.AAC.1
MVRGAIGRADDGDAHTHRRAAAHAHTLEMWVQFALVWLRLGLRGGFSRVHAHVRSRNVEPAATVRHLANDWSRSYVCAHAVSSRFSRGLRLRWSSSVPRPSSTGVPRRIASSSWER